MSEVEERGRFGFGEQGMDLPVADIICNLLPISNTLHKPRQHNPKHIIHKPKMPDKAAGILDNPFQHSSELMEHFNIGAEMEEFICV